MLEESNKRSLLGLIGLHLDKNVTVDRSVATDDEIEEAFDQLFNDERNIYLYDHFGSSDIDIIIQRITYMVKALGVRWVILDHVSILVSGLATNDERKLIDLALTRLRSEVVQELGIGLIIVSHLRRPEGDKGHEDGAKVRLGQPSRITQHSSAIRHVRGVVCRCRRPRQRHPHHLRTQEQIHRADIGFRWDRRVPPRHRKTAGRRRAFLMKLGTKTALQRHDYRSQLKERLERETKGLNSHDYCMASSTC